MQKVIPDAMKPSKGAVVLGGPTGSRSVATEFFGWPLNGLVGRYRATIRQSRKPTNLEGGRCCRPRSSPRKSVPSSVMS